MTSNVYVLIFIFLSLENVAGCSPSWRETPSQQEQPPIEKPEDGHDLEGTLNFSCSSPNLYHKWYQGYQNGEIAIGNIPVQNEVKTTRFIIKVEEFDNNTEIYCVNISNNTSTEKPKYTLLRLRFIYNTVIDKIFSLVKTGSAKHVKSDFNKTLIKIEANETCKENEERAKLEYNEKQNVSFSCLEHNEHINKTAYIELGLINTTSNMIKTYEVNSTHKIFHKTHNGTILCCVYYVVSEKAQETWITRYVTKKTLLIYNDTVQQDALRGQEFSPSHITGTDSGHPTIIIIITSAVAVVIIMLVSIVICRRRCRKKPELDTKVLYADLDILRQVKPDSIPRPGPEEESPYAQIIGEIRPNERK